jgi:hypothetical protein
MALLRALTDEVLAGRSAKLNELAKAKRLALIKYNKVKSDYAGPILNDTMRYDPRILETNTNITKKPATYS